MNKTPNAELIDEENPEWTKIMFSEAKMAAEWLTCEQYLYFGRLKQLSNSVSADDALALLDKAPDVEPCFEDRL